MWKSNAINEMNLSDFGWEWKMTENFKQKVITNSS